MRIAFLTDVHLGATAAGWQQQPRWCEGTDCLLAALKESLAAARVDLVIYGGDLVERATAQEVERAAGRLMGNGVPAVVCLGNHDLTEEGSYRYWQEAVGSRPGAMLADALLEFAECDVCALSNRWVTGGEPKLYWDFTQPVPSLLPEQLARLDEWLGRREDRPAIVAMHAPLDALGPELTGSSEPMEVMPASYVEPVREVLDRHPRVRLALAGHCHATCATRHGGRVHLSSTSLTEVPYQFPVVEVEGGRMSIRTQTLSPMGQGPAFNAAKAWVIGRPGDRVVEVG